MQENKTLSTGVRRAVEGALSARFGEPVRMAAGGQAFWPTCVFRCPLRPSNGGTTPGTVIVRIPREGTARAGQAGLHQEQAALEYLTLVGSSLAPRCLAGGAEEGFLVTEDLGTDPSLLDLLLGKEREAARQGLLGFARSLGRLHAQTARRPDNPGITLPVVHVPVTECWEQVRNAVAHLELPTPRGIEGDVEAIDRLLTEPEGGLALSSGDASVVNCKVSHGEVRFFDFEEACFRHPFVDAIVLRYPYPTGGPPWQVPSEIALEAEAAYRAALASVCPEAQDDRRYEVGMAAASAAWTILRLVRLPRVDAGPDRDTWPLLPPDWSASIPTRSRRRQMVAILQTCIASARRAGAFEALAAWCEDLTEALQERWPEAAEELPLYPAFS